MSDTQWAALCHEFVFDDLSAAARLASNNSRVASRGWLMPILRARFSGLAASELGARFERNGLPYAPITRPHELFDDPHLRATGGLAPVRLPADASAAGRQIDTRMPLLPITLAGQRLPLRSGQTALGAHSEVLLLSLGYDSDEISALRDAGIIGGATASPCEDDLYQPLNSQLSSPLSPQLSPPPC